MATTITTPAPYSSVRRPVIFTIGHPSGAACEVSINGYLKLLPDDVRSVNVAHYYQGDFRIQPEVIQGVIWKVFDARGKMRVLDACIRANGVVSEVVPLVFADMLPLRDRFTSDLRQRIAARGDLDEIPVWLTTSAVLAYGDERMPLTAGVSFVSFRIPEDAPEHFAVSLITENGEVLDRIDYECVAPGGTRMAWINDYGAVDFWTFDSRRKTTSKVTKARIYSSQGYTTTSVQAETTHTVCAQPLPEQTLGVLSRVLTSEHVWIVGCNAVQSVDVATESLAIYEADKPSTIQLEYKNSIRQL